MLCRSPIPAAQTLFLALLVYGPEAISADFTAKVISVQDGDTIGALYNQHPERIHLIGTDSPKKGQAFGKRAKQAASELVFGKQVRLQTHGKDK